MTDPKDLISSAERHFQATTITYALWKKRAESNYYKNVLATEWGAGFNDLRLAKIALTPVYPHPGLYPSETREA